MKRTILLLSACLLLLPCATRAAALDKGSVELEAGLGFDHAGYSSDGEAVGTLTRFDGSVGAAYSVTRMFQLGGGVLVSTTSYSPEGGESSSDHAFGGFADVTANFRTPNGLRPFVRVGVGAESFGGDDYETSQTSLLAPMVRTGLRFLVGDAGSVNVSAFYRHETNADGVEGDDANRFGLEIGVSLFPVRGK
jgi:hypothetical protein